jgi:selenocysteine lyase/cysteine desulfurase
MAAPRGTHRLGGDDGAMSPPVPAPASLVGDGGLVPCIDGTERPYLGLDAAASTPAMLEVADAVTRFLPDYSSVHRGAGYRSRTSTTAYEDARTAALRFAGRDPDRDVAIICRNTTEAINHLAYRLRLEPDDVVVTTVAEHHANLLPFARLCRRRHVDCGPDGTFPAEAVLAALDDGPKPRLLAITGASNVTGWSPDLDAIIPAAHERGVPVLVDAAQLAPHRPMPADADFVAWSGHKMYAPFGAGVLVGPRDAFTEGDPFLAGGGAVDLVDLDEVVWTDPPDREEAGSPNVVGAVALGAAIEQLERIGWDAIASHDDALATQLHEGLRAISGVRLLGPARPSLPLATFTVEGVPHALLAARLSAEHGIGVRHGCFCAHPYLLRLLGLTTAEVLAYKQDVLAGDRREIPGAVRASASIATRPEEVERFLAAVSQLVAEPEPPVPYSQDLATGDWWPTTDAAGWGADERQHHAPCGRG